MNLKQRFYRLISRYTEDALLIDSLWIELETKYAETHRAYHNQKHLQELFTYFDAYKQHLENPALVEFSIFYHDIIYSIWKKDNEEKSALLAIERLASLQLHAHDLDSIHEQIIATKTHTTIHADTAWMIDFDLGILGQSPAVYLDYTKSIREEYKSVPTFMYTKGRKIVLQHFINKPFIYATAAFQKLYEEQAKLNLINELNAL
ncbi:MAG: hypothetical protein JKY44_01180 [Flavobacteriaceae bacterium]|nr:hypothetical protein [Flavobacteriaceae bacterium]